jgi:adenosylcobinamide kinase/adenosylcobinamide-phosphate guanylyltransferase
VAFRKVLVLGGARSGKSAFAERLATEWGKPVLYVAIATASDDEMTERIARHQAQRPPTWRTLEVPVGVAARVATAVRYMSMEIVAKSVGVTVVIEDLTFLLSNLMAADEAQAEALALVEIDALMQVEADTILVSNEVGMGLVPPYPLGRRFRDALGRLNQCAGAACPAVYILFAGLPLQLK